MMLSQARKNLAAVVTVTAAACGWLSAEPVFYAVQGLSPFNLIEVDVGARSVSVIGSTSTLRIDDMGRDQFGNLVVFASEGEGFGPEFSVAHFIDSQTAAPTRLSTFGINTRNAMFDPADNQFYAVANFPADLGIMDPTTGTFTSVVGPHSLPFPSQLNAIALAPDGTLYGAHPIERNAELVIFDRVTARTPVVGFIGDGTDGNISGSDAFPFYALTVSALAFDPVSSVLYTVNWQNGDVYTIDTQTGAGAFLFAGGQDAKWITGMAYKGPSDVTPTCACETDGNDENVNIFDLLAFLSPWFAGDAIADFDLSGTVDIFDLLAFLDCWFDASATGVCP